MLGEILGPGPEGDRTPATGKALIAALATAILIAACGGSSSPSVATTAVTSTAAVASGSSPSTGSGGRDGAPGACSLLSRGDIDAAMGGTTGDGDLTNAPDGSQTICTWIVMGADQNGLGLELRVAVHVTAAEFDQQRNAARGQTKPVAGLGDAAYSERVTAGSQVFDDLWVHKDSVAFRLEVLKDLGSGPLEKLAQVVLPKV